MNASRALYNVEETRRRLGVRPALAHDPVLERRYRRSAPVDSLVLSQLVAGQHVARFDLPLFIRRRFGL